VVVGGGSIATRKVDALCRCGADVHIVAPTFCDTLSARSDVTLHEKEYDNADLDGAMLVFACTDKPELNRRVSQDCESMSLVCNVADDPDLCQFTVPAVLKRGPIQVAVGTAGASPYLAGRLRDLIAGWIDRAYEPFARKLAALRPVIMEREPRPDRRRSIFQRLAGRESFDRFKREGTDSWCEWISKTMDGKITRDEVILCTAKPAVRAPSDVAGKMSVPTRASGSCVSEKSQRL